VRTADALLVRNSGLTAKGERVEKVFAEILIVASAVVAGINTHRGNYGLAVTTSLLTIALIIKWLR
jgi:hypothetical protein